MIKSDKGQHFAGQKIQKKIKQKAETYHDEVTEFLLSI